MNHFTHNFIQSLIIQKQNENNVQIRYRCLPNVYFRREWPFIQHYYTYIHATCCSSINSLSLQRLLNIIIIPMYSYQPPIQVYTNITLWPSQRGAYHHIKVFCILIYMQKLRNAEIKRLVFSFWLFVCVLFFNIFSHSTVYVGNKNVGTLDDWRIHFAKISNAELIDDRWFLTFHLSIH